MAQNVRNPRFPQRRNAVHLYKILILFHCPLDGEQFKGPVDLDDYDYGEEDDGEEYETEPDEGESADAAQDEE